MNPSTANIALLIKASLNTAIRLLPIALYTGSAMSSFVFSDFRGTLLFIGFMINEFIAMGYRMISNATSNPQCALVRTENGHFSLASPVPQTIGFFCAFTLMKMYREGQFQPLTFFVIITLMVIAIWSSTNIGCMSSIDGVLATCVGLLLGCGYYIIIEDYYKRDYIVSKEMNTTNLTYDDVFFKL
mgnify:CR=1 FL=1